jgi:predicted RecB family nuclease
VSFVHRNSVSKDDKLLLAFWGLLLGEELGTPPTFGKIIHGSQYTTRRVQLAKLANSAEEILRGLQEIKHGKRVPPLHLNTHCSVCEFKSDCHETAGERDDLSLLRGLTEKQIAKLNNRGIFTITQYSYTFRPRKTRKRNGKQTPKHDYSLQALALRTKKTHVVQRPDFPVTTCRLFLDVEGIPDEGFYYLIGLLVFDGETASFHNFWANTKADEINIWNSFLAALSKVSDFTLFHYGSFEAKYLKRMHRLYGTNSIGFFDELVSSCVNVLSAIYGKVYFPTYSNDLKSVASYLGFKWSAQNASGIQSIVWRKQWEETRDDDSKAKLINYNREDCLALYTVTNALENITRRNSPNTSGSVIHTDDIISEYPSIFKRNNFFLPEFEQINRCAYFDYQRARIYVRTNPATRRSLRRRERKKKTNYKANKEVYCARPSQCPFCNASSVWKHGEKSKMVYGLKLFRGGIKRWIVMYNSHRYICGQCNKTFNSPSYKSVASSRYGHSMIAWIVYQNIVLLNSHGTIREELGEIFGYCFRHDVAAHLKKTAAHYYEPAYRQLVSKIREGDLVHVDETKVSIKGKTGYVWAFTNLEWVLYVYSDTREGDILLEILDGFDGVLVSDFYAAYDSVQCAQQKCLIHLIRDMNDDLFKNPFDDELGSLARDFTELLTPIVGAIDKYGLKRWHLRKYKVRALRFLDMVLNRSLTSDIAIRYQRRFRKYKDKLFTFLDYDGVPWNNNNAEHAIKQFVFLRRVIGGSSTPEGIREYLVLLSICETLKLLNVSVLKFLMSASLDIGNHRNC